MAKQNSTRTSLATRHNGLETESKPQSLLAEYSALRYDYDRVAARHRRAVQDAAVDIRRKQRRVMEDLLAIGRRLLEVKDLLAHGDFGKWIEEEFELSERIAQGMMNAARIYSDEAKARRVALLPERAIYFLAAPSTPQAARDEVERLLELRQTLTSAEVEQIIREHRLALGDKTPAEPPPQMLEMNAEVSVVVIEPTFASVADLARLVVQQLPEVSGRDSGTQIYSLDSMARGEHVGTLDRLAGWIKREGNVGDFRHDDLIEAIKQVAEQKREVRVQREAKKKPTPPSPWELREPIEKWLGEHLSLSPKDQRDLLTAMQQQEAAHPLHASLAETLPAAWRMDDLKRAMGYIFESLDAEIGQNEWAARQLPSGRWYAFNRGRYNRQRATELFDTEAEALAATDRAEDSLADLYRRFEQVMSDPYDGYSVRSTINGASPEWLLEIRAGLEQHAAKDDTPAFVAERLAEVNRRINQARQLVELVTPQPAPSMLATLDEQYKLQAAATWAEARDSADEAAAIDADYIVTESAQAPKPHLPFDAWLLAMPAVEHWDKEGRPNLRECLAILELAKAAAQRARTLEPALYYAVGNAMPTLSQLIIASEKASK